jgi:hypothetical protein
MRHPSSEATLPGGKRQTERDALILERGIEDLKHRGLTDHEKKAVR